MKKITAILFIGLLSLSVMSQKSLQEKQDSIASYKAYYYYVNAPEQLHNFDTTINNIEEYNFVQRATDEYINLGNIGTAAFPLLIKPYIPSGFQNGIRMYDLYWLYMDSVKMYNIKRPYSELTMNLGLRQELNFSGNHSQNLGRNFQYGISFNRINSIGYYQRQRTLGNTACLYTRYITKNKKFVSLLCFVYNGFKNQENGGLSSDIFTNATEALLTKSLADVRLSNAQSNYREVALQGSQSYEIGYKYDEKVNDTLTIKNYQPIANIKYQIKFANNKFNFVDKSATIDSSYYESFYYSNIYNVPVDTLSNTLRYNSITQSISFNFLGTRKIKNYKGKFINLVAGAKLEHENIELRQNFYERTSNNLSIEGFVRSNSQANKKWNYLAFAKFFLAGYNQGDIELRGKFSYDFSAFGYLQIAGLWSRREANWTENNYYNYAGSWSNNFNKTNTLLLQATYTNKLTKNKFKFNTILNASNYIINQYIYWNNNMQATQLSNTLNIFQAEATINMAYGKVHLDNYFCFQKASTNSIHLPTYYIKNSLYYERLMFKKALLIRFGIDSRYISAYYANGYQPLTGQFYTQDKIVSRYTPLIDVFINAKIKTVRIFIKGNNLFQGIGLKGNYNAYLYPSDERSFKFGVTWRFLD